MSLLYKSFCSYPAGLRKPVIERYPFTPVKLLCLVQIDRRIFQPAAGGLPVSSSGRGTLMLSGGIDSPVAGYLMARRGLRVTVQLPTLQKDITRTGRPQRVRLSAIM